MSGTGQRFDPSELGTAGEPELPGEEQADLLLAARALERVTAEGVRPTDGFEDRIMAAIALEAAPKLVVRPGAAVRGGRPAAFLLAVRDAWGVAMSGGRPLGVRAQALAFVLLFVVAVGSVTGAATVTVGGLLLRQPGPTPSVDDGPTDGTAEPSESAEPSEPAEPGETAKPNATSKPTAAPSPTRTPHPTDTPAPGTTPKPTETPGSSDDHGGGGSGSSGG